MPHPASGPSVHAVLLAAGASRRFGADNKLLAEIAGVPLVRRVAENVLASSIAGATVVTGFEADAVRAALDGLEVEYVHNADHDEGLASSLRAGVAAVPPGAGGAMIVLGDMPGLTAALLDTLIAAFAQAGGEKIVYPVGGDGAQRNPVIWPRKFFAALRKLEGDAGAKSLVAGHTQESMGVPVDEEDVFRDIDEVSDLSGWTVVQPSKDAG